MNLRYASRCAAVASLTLAACSEQPVAPVASPNLSQSVSATSAAPGRYLVVFRSATSIPGNFASEVARLGGKVESTMPGIGAAVVSGLPGTRASELSRVSGVQSVDIDQKVPLRYRKAEMSTSDAAVLSEVSSPSAPATAGLFAVQWNMRAISAPAAWTAGFRGSSTVRIGIIDSGIDEGLLVEGSPRTNIDLLTRVDRTLSRSFIPEEDTVVQRLFPGAPLWTDLDGHGTNVASQVTSNAINFAGVTSQTKVVSLKACTILPFDAADTTAAPGYCSTASVFEALYYAADNNLDVVNMSLGGGFVKNQCNGCTSLINRVIQYATSRGTTIVVAAGNSAMDLDHNKGFYNTYCDAPTVICVSATGPVSAGPGSVGPFPGVDDAAIYTNFGRSAIDVAGPGGNYAVNGSGALVSAAFVYSLCPRLTAAFYDTAAKVSKPVGPCGAWGFLGTSQASPHVAGLAALLVPQLGRNPGAIRERIMNTADKITGGTSPYYGKGRINVARGVGAI